MWSTDALEIRSNIKLSEHLESFKYNNTLTTRINQLQETLGILREALQAERLNLRQDIQLNSWTICRDEGFFISEEVNINKEVVPYFAESSFNLQCYHGAGECDCSFSCLNTKVSNSNSCLKISEEIQLDPYPFDLNIFWIAPTTSTSNYYKQKIFDLEADCRASLNKIKSKFMASLQSFEDTLDLKELYCDQKESENKFQERIVKTPREGSKGDEEDIICPYNPVAHTKFLKNFLPDSSASAINFNRSLIANNVQNYPSRNVCSGRNSDSNICGVIFKSTQLQHEPTQIFALEDSISDSTMSTLSESPDLSTSQANLN